ncbi:ATP-binding protein [Streptomyces sp. URMC 123]|uniref:ATP-binding protein n=1 Tax=Streptomyces sp. URMC 123 TaxID=3423403 RepID=UPI003F1B506D
MAAAALAFGPAGVSQASEPPNVGGLTTLDPAGLGATVDGAAQRATNIAGDAGSKAVKKGVPTAGKVGGKVSNKAMTRATSTAQEAAGDATDVLADATDVLGEAAVAATESGPPIDRLPTGELIAELPMNQLPVKGGLVR